jgi:hypothetical protein
VETDCKQLVQALEKEDQDRSSWAGLIKELKGAIQLLPEVRLNHVRREQNQAAHNLAQLALRQVVCKTARFSVPLKLFHGLIGIDQTRAARDIAVTLLYPNLMNLRSLTKKNKKNYGDKKK